VFGFMRRTRRRINSSSRAEIEKDAPPSAAGLSNKICGSTIYTSSR